MFHFQKTRVSTKHIYEAQWSWTILGCQGCWDIHCKNPTTKRFSFLLVINFLDCPPILDLWASHFRKITQEAFISDISLSVLGMQRRQAEETPSEEARQWSGKTFLEFPSRNCTGSNILFHLRTNIVGLVLKQTWS